MIDHRYTDDHKWAVTDSNGDVFVGITQFAQDELGEVVFVDLPKVGATLQRGEEAAVVESVKAAGEVKSPITGEVLEINETLVDAPEIVNQSPESKGWFYKVRPVSDSVREDELALLMDNDAYQALVKELS